MTNLTFDTDLVQQVLTGFIHGVISQAGYSRAVIALSGGLDSTLSCYLTVQALGPENVLAVRMPYRSSSVDSLEHAQLVIDRLGIKSLTISITEMVEPLFERFPDMNQVRRGNVMARARMIVIYDQSEAFGGLVVGTGNKTEILLGYTTLYGDSACALNPLGDLYKTQVRQLSRAIGVPAEIVEKPPSADLWPGQTDEGELGFTYEQVDQLLFLLVDQQYSPQDCIEAGYSQEFVAKVVERIRCNHFKRVLPPIARLSDRTVGDDLSSLQDCGK